MERRREELQPNLEADMYEEPCDSSGRNCQLRARPRGHCPVGGREQLVGAQAREGFGEYAARDSSHPKLRELLPPPHVSHITHYVGELGNRCPVRHQ